MSKLSFKFYAYHFDVMGFIPAVDFALRLTLERFGKGLIVAQTFTLIYDFIDNIARGSVLRMFCVSWYLRNIHANY